MMCSLMKFATVAPSARFIGIASTHFVLNSVAARIHWHLFDGGDMGPIRSRAQVWNGHGVRSEWRSTAGAWIRFPCF